MCYDNVFFFYDMLKRFPKCTCVSYFLKIVLHFVRMVSTSQPLYKSLIINIKLSQ